MEINPRVSTYIYGKNYCAPYLSLKLAMGEMSANEGQAFQDKLPIGQALETYTILTIGDGLASRTPALLLSVATGFLITRSRVKTR